MFTPMKWTDYNIPIKINWNSKYCWRLCKEGKCICMKYFESVKEDTWVCDYCEFENESKVIVTEYEQNCKMKLINLYLLFVNIFLNFYMCCICHMKILFLNLLIKSFLK